MRTKRVTALVVLFYPSNAPFKDHGQQGVEEHLDFHYSPTPHQSRSGSHLSGTLCLAFWNFIPHMNVLVFSKDSRILEHISSCTAPSSLVVCPSTSCRVSLHELLSSSLKLSQTAMLCLGSTFLFPGSWMCLPGKIPRKHRLP